jgi:hypothetical protein
MATKTKDASTAAALVEEPVEPAEYERRFDPQREAAQRAALRDHARRQAPGEFIPLGNGEFVRVQHNVNLSYPGEKAYAMLGEPEKMLIKAKPPFQFGVLPNGKPREGPRYKWFVRTSIDPRDDRPAETANLHRSQRIRYVEVSEVDKNSPIAVYTEFATANNTYVTYRSLILAEIMSERLSYESKPAWEDLAIARVSSLPNERLTEPGTHIGNADRPKAETRVSVKDTRQGG